MRVYLPVSALDLAKASANPERPSIDPSGRLGYAVTEKLRTDNPELDEEELEWEAFSYAAGIAGVMLYSKKELPPMRVVLSVDLPERIIREPEPSDDSQINKLLFPPSAVQVQRHRRTPIIAIHVDDPAASAWLEEIRANPDALDSGSAPADDDLLWYDPSEIADIPIPGPHAS